MNRILLVERIHQAGEAMLVQKAELVYPQPQNLEGILAAIAQGVLDVLEGRRPQYPVNP